MQASRHQESDFEARLILEPAPPTEQLAPAQSLRFPMLITVAGNLLVAAALLGSLLLAPALLSGIFPAA